MHLNEPIIFLFFRNYYSHESNNFAELGDIIVTRCHPPSPPPTQCELSQILNFVPTTFFPNGVNSKRLIFYIRKHNLFCVYFYK